MSRRPTRLRSLPKSSSIEPAWSAWNWRNGRCASNARRPPACSNRSCRPWAINARALRTLLRVYGLLDEERDVWADTEMAARRAAAAAGLSVGEVEALVQRLRVLRVLAEGFGSREAGDRFGGIEVDVGFRAPDAVDEPEVRGGGRAPRFQVEVTAEWADQLPADRRRGNRSRGAGRSGGRGD